MKTLEVLDRVMRGKRLSERSKANYRLVFKCLAEYSEDWPDSVGVASEWLGSLERFSDKTVELWFSIARSAGRYMDKVWKVENPFELVERPKVAKKKRRYLRAEEMVKVIRACSTEYEGCLVMTLIDSACRVDELAGLERKNVNVEGGYILVKGKTGERRYRLDSRLCERILGLCPEGESVFGGVRGSGLSMRVMRIMRRAGLVGEKLGAHTLRHSSGSLVAKTPGGVLAVKAILQHDSVTSSMVYIHDVEEEAQKAISPLGLLSKYLDVGDGVKQLPMVGTSDGGDGVESVVEAMDESVEELGFCDVADGVSIRPLLRADDLRLLRCALVEYSKGFGMGKAAVLWKRMLRRVK